METERHHRLRTQLPGEAVTDEVDRIARWRRWRIQVRTDSDEWIDRGPPGDPIEYESWLESVFRMKALINLGYDAPGNLRIVMLETTSTVVES